MKLAVQKNHLGGQILYRNLDPVKKTASNKIFCLQASGASSACRLRRFKQKHGEFRKGN